MTAKREIAITYGSVIVGGISEYYHLDGFTRNTVTDGKADSYLEFDVAVTADSAAALVQRCAALEREFRTPRLALVVAQEGQILLNVSPSSASGGFNTEPEIRKVGKEGDSARSRLYTMRVRYETPADTATTSGLRESSVNVEYNAARIATVRISGTFTAVPGTTSARARYDAAIAAHAASVMSSLSISVYELVEEPTSEHDYDDKVIRFDRTYRELVFGQGQDSPSNDSGIVDQSLKVSRREFSEERTAISGAIAANASVQMLATFDVRYECSIDSTVTTALKSKYDSIRSWLVGQIRAVFSQGQFALIEESPEFDRAGNRIMVTMVAQGPVGGQSLVSRTVTVNDTITEPVVFRNAWTGDPLAAYIYEGHAIVTRTINETYRKIGTATSADAAQRAMSLPAMFGYPPARYVQGTWHLIESDGGATGVRIGIEGKDVMDLVDVTAMAKMRRVLRIAGETKTVALGPAPTTTP